MTNNLAPFTPVFVFTESPTYPTGRTMFECADYPGVKFEAWQAALLEEIRHVREQLRWLEPGMRR